VTRRNAIDIALNAAGKPGVASLMSVGPLPDGIKSLLRIVAEGEWRDASTETAYRSHTPEQVRAASAAFLGSILFDRASDPYRVLGLSPGATLDDVRENKRLLLKWLHPDRNPRRQEQEYLARVIEAAEAIEEGRSALPPLKSIPPQASKHQPHSAARAAPRNASSINLRKTSGAPKPPPWRSEARSAVARGLGSLVRLTRATALAAIVALASLVAWRYAMHEPIGVSLARYSKLALAALPW